MRNWFSPLSRSAVLLFAALAFTSCEKPSGTLPGAAGGAKVKSLGTIEVSAKLLEVPDGAIFKRDLYDYATILKYEVVQTHRGALEKGATLYVGHYNPWKPRVEAPDRRVTLVGGNLRQFQAGQVHHMALEVPIEDHFMGGIVNKYFGQATNTIYWAVWTDLE